MSGSIFKCKPVYKDGKVLVGTIPAYPPYWTKPRHPISYTCKGKVLALPDDHPAYLPLDVEEWSPTKDYNLWDCVKKWYPGNGIYEPARWMYFVNRLSEYTNYGIDPLNEVWPCLHRWESAYHWQSYSPCGGAHVPDWSPTYPIWTAVALFKHNGRYWWIEFGGDEGEPPWYCPDPPSETTYGWHEYFPASSTNYASIEPFGGFGNSPPKYRVSVVEKYTSWDRFGFDYSSDSNYQMVLTGGGIYGWGGIYEQKTYWRRRRYDWYDSPIDSSTEVQSFQGYIAIGECGVEIGRWTLQSGNSQKTILLYPYKVEASLNTGWENKAYCNHGCCLKGTRSGSTSWSYNDPNWGPSSSESSIQVSWRPEDCTYSSWDSTAVYEIDACVSHAGKFFKACQRSGPGTLIGVVEPNDNDPEECGINTVWRNVV